MKVKTQNTAVPVGPRPPGCTADKSFRYNSPRLPLFIVAILLTIIFLSGCAEHRRTLWPDLMRFTTHVSPKLIVNTVLPPAIDPQLFAHRSLWPAADGYANLRDTVDFTELWYDRQTLWPSRHDHSFKLFRSRRHGSQIP